MKKILFNFAVLSLVSLMIRAQPADPGTLTIDRIFASSEFRQDRLGPVSWHKGGETYIKLEPSSSGGLDIVEYNVESGARQVLVPAGRLRPQGADQPLVVEDFQWSRDGGKLLFFTNSQRVWRTNSRGDYWLYNLDTDELRQIGAGLPASSLMFAKFSPDETMVGYVSAKNVYVEDLLTGKIIPMTRDGADGVINGTFDWVYEEELFCKDGFRWSPDGQSIAFWQVDASEIGNFLMINNTDSIYSQIIPIQYPKVGQDPSSVRIGVVGFTNRSVRWMQIPGDPRQNYLPRMQWVDSSHILVTQLNRKQNEYRLWLCDIRTGQAENIYTETDEAWVDVVHMDLTMPWVMDDLPTVDNGRSVLRLTDKDGWRHVYKISLDSLEETLLTPGNYDVARTYLVDEGNGYLYFNASPKTSTQRYLYRVPLDGSGHLTPLTPEDSWKGVNNYDLASNGQYAIHTHSSSTTPPTTHLIKLEGHELIRTLVDNRAYKQKIAALDFPEIEFSQVTTADDIKIDVKVIKPTGFDPGKKYPVLFNVYGEPAGQIASDSWGSLWDIMLAQRGYVVIKMDNRGTPCLKGREWRKSIYRQLGILNTRDQAMAAREVIKWDYIDPSRVAVWGWSGGGAMTLNLMFRYPDVYGTGMSVAPVTDQRLYDNIYQERYMGLLTENPEDYIKGSPITVAANLRGNLLLVHGTADDNVHFQNSELLVNRLITHNKKFTFMPYPGRSHGIYEMENTTRHLYTLLTDYLEQHCPVSP